MNEKDVDEFNKAEENQNAKSKTELDHSYIASDTACMSIDRREWKNCRRLNSRHRKCELKTFVDYRFYCKYSFYIVIKVHFLLNF